MSIFNQVKIPVASKESSKMRFNCIHTTTSDFMQLGVSYLRHMVPGQKLDVNVSLFSRLAPMPVPTLGRCNIKHHAFFVPFSSVMPSWSDFITDTPHVQANSSTAGLVTYAHRVSIASLSQVFFSSPYVTTTTLPATFNVFTGTAASPSVSHYRPTAKGRHILKILRQLGYQLDPDLRSDSPSLTTYVSALPLLCLLRVYLDYYYPSQYVGDTEYNYMMALLKRDNVGGYTLTNSDVGYIYLYLTNVCFDADYFTAAFDNPSGPNTGLASNVTLYDSSVGKAAGQQSRVVSNFNSSAYYPTTPSLTGQGSGATNISTVTEYGLSLLHSLSDYMKRHQLVGSRAIDRFLARFGIKVNDRNTSKLLGSFTVPVDFGAVMSNAGTQDAALGSYAGQGFALSRDKSHFSVEADDYGIFFITSSIVPEIGYVQGIDRNILHLSKLDFFTPEFDGKGTQAISAAELMTNSQVQDDWQTGEDQLVSAMLPRIFGFTPRYAEYKVQHDKLTGDFELNDRNNAGMSSSAWHLFRLFNFSADSSAVHSKSFIFPDWGDSSGVGRFDRIFDNQTQSADHFVLNYNFEIVSYFPGCALYDSFDFEDEDGKKMLMEVGGVKVN